MPSATPGCPRLPTRFHLDKAEVAGSSPRRPSSSLPTTALAARMRSDDRRAVPRSPWDRWRRLGGPSRPARRRVPQMPVARHSVSRSPAR